MLHNFSLNIIIDTTTCMLNRNLFSFKPDLQHLFIISIPTGKSRPVQFTKTPLPVCVTSQFTRYVIFATVWIQLHVRIIQVTFISFSCVTWRTSGLDTNALSILFTWFKKFSWYSNPVTVYTSTVFRTPNHWAFIFTPSRIASWKPFVFRFL